MARFLLFAQDRLFGPPPDQKRNVVAEGVHYVPRTVFVGETLARLDRYLGPVR